MEKTGMEQPLVLTLLAAYAAANSARRLSERNAGTVNPKTQMKKMNTGI